MKIRSMLILSLIFFSVVSMIAYCVFFNISSGNTARNQYNSFMSSIVSDTGENMSIYISTLSSAAGKVSYNASISDFTAAIDDSDKKTAAQNSALTYIAEDTGISRIIIVDSSANIKLTTDDKYEMKMTAEKIAALNSGSVYLSPIYTNDKVSDYEIVTKIELNEQNLLVFFSKTEISSILNASLFPTNGRVVLIDSNHGILDTSYVGLAEEVDLPEYRIIDEILADSSKLNSVINFDIANNSRLAYAIPVNSTGWYAVAYGEAKQALTFSNSGSGSLTAGVVVLSMILIAGFIILVMFVTKPLASIEETLLKIKRGDHESRIEIMSRNEYGDIARAFNSLLDEIIVSERRYRTIVEMSNNIVFEWNFKTNEIFFSNNFNKKFSYRAPSDHYSDSFLLKGKVHPDDYDRYRTDLEKLAKGVEFKDNEYRWKNIYGDYIWSSLRTATIRDKDGEIVKIVGVISDIDRAKKSETLLIARASYDALTGVYNRETIENILDGEIEKLTPTSEECAILFVDIDDFKIYNDKYSHATGDQVLKFVAETLQGTVKEYGFVGRYGGDEFVVCVRNAVTNSPSRISNDILQTLKDGFVCDTNVHLSVNVSIGISIIKDSNKHVEEIIANADDAMYRIKKSGKSSYGFF